MLRDTSLFVEVNGKWLENRIKEIFYAKEGTEYKITGVDVFEIGGYITAEIFFNIKEVYVTANVESYVDRNGKFDIKLDNIELIEL